MELSLRPESSERIYNIKHELIKDLPGICSERTRYYTSTYRENEKDPVIIRRAKALSSYLDNMTIYLSNNDLIPGYQASRPRFAPVFPEYSWKWIFDELDTFDKRKYDAFYISDDVKDELRDLLPFWNGKSLFEKITNRQPDFCKKASEIGVTSWTGQATSGEGHIIVDYQTVLEFGYVGIIEKAETALKNLRLYDPDDLAKRDFLESVIIVYNGVIRFIERHADHAGTLAKVEKNEDRKNELNEIEISCRNLMSAPPASFQEALYTVWFTHLIQQMESNGHSVSLGRFDQYLYSFYLADINSGRLDRETVLELICHFFLKLYSIIKIRPEKHSRTQSGYPMYQNCVVGGQNSKGKDETNELSWHCLSAIEIIRLPEPNFYVRVHEHLSPDFFLKALKVSQLGFGMPAFVNDKVVIESLVRRGVSREDAVNYSTMGCLEVMVPGKWGYRANGKSKVNLLKILELALNNGCDPKTGIKLKEGKGEVTELKTFYQLLSAWREQLSYYTQVHVTSDNINDYYIERLVPNPFCSGMVQDCIDRGKHLNEGGAVYDMTSGALVGLPNVGNSLAALKKLVYENNEITLDDLKSALEDNFRNGRYTQIRQMLLNRTFKFGEDEDYVDDLTADALRDYTDIISNYRNLRYNRGPIGGNYYPSTVTISQNVPAGEVVGATPDGRMNGEPTAEGVSPAMGTGKKGPTAILQSIAKLPTVEMTGGQLLNLRINKKTFDSLSGLKKMTALIRGFFRQDGWHVQFNTISTEELVEAVKNPDNNKDLIVRVAGYSAQFVALDPSLQRDIISRMEHEI